jgi:hypothetical protein
VDEKTLSTIILEQINARLDRLEANLHTRLTNYEAQAIKAYNLQSLTCTRHNTDIQKNAQDIAVLASRVDSFIKEIDKKSKMNMTIIGAIITGLNGLVHFLLQVYKR